ncbi:hypothetical protein [Kitasatospora sp. NPDC005856]|uniref:hypothetical protein n=1 Tax=Kitasatospora sp. NPDC005856 TaxID=3154566 RepID=UPI0033D14EBD
MDESPGKPGIGRPDIGRQGLGRKGLATLERARHEGRPVRLRRSIPGTSVLREFAGPRP